MYRFFFIMILVIGCTISPDINPDVVDDIPSLNKNAWESLPLRDKIAQMIMVRIRGDYYHSEHYYRKLLKRWLEKDGIGGVITFGGSVHGTYYNIKQFQSWAKYPLLVAADYERGLGQWVSGGTLFPSNMALAATGDTTLAYDQGKITAIEAKALGVHITFSPVMDINSNPDNPIINFRSYSDDRTVVNNFGGAFINGAQSNGLIACAKHYPGHGNTSVDSHTSLPSIDGSRLDLDSLELYPFKGAVKAGVNMIMVGHIALPGLDSARIPASHSYTITSKILRDEMGFDGIIITDGMEMGGLTQSAWAGESAVRAIEAGVDILLLPIDLQHTIDSIEKAVISGRISEKRINESVSRIWKMKYSLGLLNQPAQIPFDKLEKKIGIPTHIKKAKEIANKSITIVKDDNNILPLHPEEIDSIAHVILSLDDGVKSYIKSFSSNIKKTHGHVSEIFINNPISDLGRKDILNQLSGIDQIVVSLIIRIRMDKGIATIDSTHSMLLQDLKNTNIPMATFSFGSPYLPRYDILENYVCVYGYGSISVKSAADVLWGRINTRGELPVNLNNSLIRGFGIKKKVRTKKWGSQSKITFDKANSIIDNAIKSKNFPGAQIAIVKEGELIYSKGMGRHKYDSDSKIVTKSTIYDVASLTKVLVTVPVIMKLVSQKKIALDQEINQFYPKFIGGGKENVTIRHLLTHSSGLESYVPFYQLDNISNKDDILNYILYSELIYFPGTKMTYSDLGYILLSFIVEKVSNKKFDKLAESWVFNNLQMNNTKFNPPKELINNIAPTEVDTSFRNKLIHGVVHDENTFIMNGVSGHAGIFSTAEDIAKYAQMWIDGGIWKGNRIFKESQIKEFMLKQNLPIGSDFAIGWDTPSQNGRSSAGDYFSSGTIGHLGFTGTSLWIDPDKEIVIVLLANRVHPSRKGDIGKKEMYDVRRNFHNAVMAELLNEN